MDAAQAQTQQTNDGLEKRDGKKHKKDREPSRDNVQLGMHYLYTDENIAKVLEMIGETEAARRVRNKERQGKLMRSVSKTWNKGIQVKHVVTFIAVAGALYLVYEGVRYLLRDTVDLPGFIKYSAGPASVTEIKSMKKAG